MRAMFLWTVCLWTVCLWTVCGCSPATESLFATPIAPAAPSTLARAVPPTLTLAIDVLVARGEATFTVTGAAANETVYLVRSTQGPGLGPCFGSLGLLCVDVLGPNLQGNVSADAGGVAALLRKVPATVPVGTDVWFQAVIQRGTTGAGWLKSNTIQMQVEGNLAAADATLLGQAGNDFAGGSVAAAGDVNGDGYDDLLVGAPYNDEGGLNAGAGYLVLGPVAGTVDLGNASAKFLGEADDDRAGSSVSGAGDVNGDGYDDILIAAKRNDEGGINAGAAYLMYGPIVGTIDLANADAKLVGEANYDYVDKVSSAGDVNGDGYDDLLVGSFWNDQGGNQAGAAYLVLGPIAGTIDLSNADAILVGEAADDEAGASVSGAGDVNGDGYDDILVGAHYQDEGGTNAGAAYLLHGPVTGTVNLAAADAKFVGEFTADFAGYVSGPGDVNGDGYDDILVGASGNDRGGDYAGTAYLVLGPVAGTVDLATADAILVGENPGDAAASSIAGAGDVNGDGLDDLLVGAQWNDEGGLDAGAAYVVVGPVVGIVDLADARKFVGLASGDYAGTAVAGAGDVDSDGYDDLIIGADWNDENVSNAGAAYAVFGGP